MRRRPRWCRDISQSGAQSLHSFQAILDRGAFRFSERDLLFEALQIGLGLKQLSLARSFRHIERTFCASHAMWALVKKIITAVSMPKVVIFPRLALRRLAAFHCLLIHQDINQTAVPLEVACLGVRLRELAGMIFA